jgi:peptide/nickel transport system substrate-binding protein
MKRRLAFGLSVAVGALMGFAAEAKTLRWSSPTDLTTLDPYAHTESFTTSMLHHVFDIHWCAAAEAWNWSRPLR